MGQLPVLAVLAAGLAAQSGSQVLIWSAQPRPLAWGITAVLLGVQLPAAGVLAVEVRRLRRRCGAAARSGAVPIPLDR